MTTEFAILNRGAIVLAASSGTPANDKGAWTNSHKLFSLGPANQMAIMVWGNDTFAGIPWAMLVDTFKAEVGRKRFKTVADCGTEFMRLLKDERFQSDNAATTGSTNLILQNLEKLRSPLPESMATTDVEQLRRATCTDLIAELRKHKPISGAPLFYQFSPQIKRALLRSLAKTMLRFSPTPTLLRQIEWAIFEAATRQIASGGEFGVVIAGYGHTEHFPSVQEYIVDGKYGDFTRIWLRDKHSVDGASARSQVLEFGANGDLQTFMSGVAPEYVNFMDGAFSELLEVMPHHVVGANDHLVDGTMFGQEWHCRVKSKLKQKFLDDFADFRNKKFTAKVMDHVRNLSKAGLVDYASTIVESTSLMARVFASKGREVNPVDLAVISRGDGFVWANQPATHKSSKSPHASEPSEAHTTAPTSAA